jgi:hypothetical protein
MTTRRKPKKVVSKAELKAAADAARNAARARLREHASTQKEELLIVLGECRCPKCNRVEFATMTDITHKLADMPSWQFDADGERLFVNERYETLRDLVFQMRAGTRIETFVGIVCGVHNRLVRLNSPDDEHCQCNAPPNAVVLPFRPRRAAAGEGASA